MPEWVFLPVLPVMDSFTGGKMLQLSEEEILPLKRQHTWQVYAGRFTSLSEGMSSEHPKLCRIRFLNQEILKSYGSIRWLICLVKMEWKEQPSDAPIRFQYFLI